MSISGNPHLLSVDECEHLINYFDLADKDGTWIPSDDPYWNRRAIEAMSIQEPQTVSILKRAYGRVKAAMPNGAEASVFRLVIWRTGTTSNLHVDNIYAGRDYSSIVYLNDDFCGGFTVFPDQGVSVEPKAGMGIVFDGDEKHPHFVTDIEYGTRYTIASFWTTDPQYMVYEGWCE